VKFQEEALRVILRESEGYPYFLQLWGFHAWEAASRSPITARDAAKATRQSLQDLDQGFFKLRYDRLTERQQQYVGAMARLDSLPASSSEVAKALGITVQQAAPIREEVIQKGVAYSPRRGKVAFTVPKFDEYLRRLA